jgi:hypothetical protein
MMQWVRKRNSGKICRRSGRAQKRCVELPRASASFCRSNALAVTEASTVEEELPLIIFTLLKR